MVKEIIKEKKIFSHVITVIATLLVDSFIVDLLLRKGYVQWLDKLIQDTLTVYEDLSLLKYLKVMGMDIVGVISFFIILYLMLDGIPNLIANVMGLDIKQ